MIEVLVTISLWCQTGSDWKSNIECKERILNCWLESNNHGEKRHRECFNFKKK